MQPKRALLAVLVFLAAAPAAPAYDMDCKLLLCLAGGFPPGCADAKAYMIARLASAPPKPPIGFCAFTGGGYDDYEVEYGRVRHSPEKYECAPGLRVHIHGSEGRDGDAGAICYERAEEICAPGPDSVCTTRFHGEAAVRRDFEWVLDVTVAPGSERAFRSGRVFVDLAP